MSNIPRYDALEVEPGRFVPTDTAYVKFGGDDPHQHLLQHPAVHQVTVDENYPYEDNSWRFKLLNWFYYWNAKWIVLPLDYLRYGYRIRGLENVKNNKELFKQGGLTISNHIFRWDICGVLQTHAFSQMRFPVYKEILHGPDWPRIIGTGGVPLPDKLSAMKHFYAAFDHFHQKGYWMHFFAEESRWEFYTPIRPFKKGAFIFAERYNMPILPLAYSYRERKGLLKLFGKEACVTLNVGEPIVADPALKGNRAATVEDLRKRTHEAIVKLAGITKNPWHYNDTEK